MTIALACDHGAYHLKEILKAHLTEAGHTLQDFGTDSTESCDYPKLAADAARAVASGQAERGIVLCTTGIGVSIAANKIQGIRCALCTDPLSAEMTRRHNDTNVLALGAGITGTNLALHIVDIWLNTAFEDGRHARRVKQLMDLEQL